MKFLGGKRGWMSSVPAPLGQIESDPLPFCTSLAWVLFIETLVKLFVC